MTLAYPFNETGTLGLHEAYHKALRAPGMGRVQLPYGEPAWLAVRYDDARLVLGDKRFSRAVAATPDAPRMRPRNADGGILSMDPPDHVWKTEMPVRGPLTLPVEW